MNAILFVLPRHLLSNYMPFELSKQYKYQTQKGQIDPFHCNVTVWSNSQTDSKTGWKVAVILLSIKFEIDNIPALPLLQQITMKEKESFSAFNN